MYKPHPFSKNSSKKSGMPLIYRNFPGWSSPCMMPRLIFKNSLLSTHACSSAYQREGVMEDHSLGVSNWVCMFNSFDHFPNVKKKFHQNSFHIFPSHSVNPFSLGLEMLSGVWILKAMTLLLPFSIFFFFGFVNAGMTLLD